MKSFSTSSSSKLGFILSIFINGEEVISSAKEKFEKIKNKKN